MSSTDELAALSASASRVLACIERASPQLRDMAAQSDVLMREIMSEGRPTEEQWVRFHGQKREWQRVTSEVERSLREWAFHWDQSMEILRRRYPPTCPPALLR